MYWSSPGSSVHPSVQFSFSFIVSEARSPRDAQAALELIILLSCLLSAGAIGGYHDTQLRWVSRIRRCVSPSGAFLLLSETDETLSSGM